VTFPDARACDVVFSKNASLASDPLEVEDVILLRDRENSAQKMTIFGRRPSREIHCGGTSVDFLHAAGEVDSRGSTRSKSI
jgi:hypothetical protein